MLRVRDKGPLPIAGDVGDPLPTTQPAVNDSSSLGDANKKVDSDSNEESTQPDEAQNSSEVQAALAAQAIAPQHNHAKTTHLLQIYVASVCVNMYRVQH